MPRNVLPELRICQNCETPVDGKFCPECGQDTRDHRVSMRLLLLGLWNDFFTFDSRFFRSFIPLMFLPGKLTVEFVRGRRVRYIPPIRLYLFVSILFFFLISMRLAIRDADDTDAFSATGPVVVSADSIAMVPMGVDSLRTLLREAQAEVAELEKLEDRLPVGIELDVSSGIEQALAGDYDLAALDSLAAAGVDTVEIRPTDLEGYSHSQVFGRDFYLKNGYLTRAILRLLPKALFLLLPIFAALLALVYLRRKRLFIEHLVFSLHYHSMIFLAYAIVALTSWTALLPPMIVGFYVYLYFAMKRVYGQGWRKTWLKHFLLTAAYNVVLIVFLGGVAVASIMLVVGGESHPRLLGWLLG